jgi:short-subunit dehydrogenase
VTTALVTGASAGIGEAFARELALRGHDLVLVARRADRLEAEAARLAEERGIDVEPLSADLSTAAGVAAVAARLDDADRPIDLLVNNAGSGAAGRFWELPVDGELATIDLNVAALVQLTHAALGPMVARDAGGVINVSSLAGYQPTPLSATYGATKAFISSFTNAVRDELRGTNVRLMVLAPGFTRTEFQEKSFGARGLPEFAWQSADTVVATALRAYERGRGVCITGAVNVAAAAASKVMPAGVIRRITGAVTRYSY